MEKELVPLGALGAGEIGVIEELRGGHGFVSRLSSLGFTPGARIEVVQNYGHGPLIVAIRDSQIALGRGQAMKVYVSTPEGGKGERRA